MANNGSGWFTAHRAILCGVVMMLAAAGVLAGEQQDPWSELEGLLVEAAECGRCSDQGRLCGVLDAAGEAIHSETDSTLQAMLAGRLFSGCQGVSREALDGARSRLTEYVPVLALGGDPSQAPSLQAVPRACFSVDGSGRPIGFIGPHLSVRLPETIAVGIDWGSLGALKSVANPLRATGLDEDGTFVADPESGDCSLVLATEFAVASRLLASAEQWAGRPVPWGRGGQLALVPYASVCNAPVAYYNQLERKVVLGALGSISGNFGLAGFTGLPYTWQNAVVDLLVDTARNPDAAAHEAGHAAVSALKPGWGSGVVLLLHEALADTTAVLTALQDPAVLDRVLRETGGDLRQANEASRLYEEIGSAIHRYADDDPSNDGDRSLRSVIGLVLPEECKLEPDDVEMPTVFITFGPVGDPHCAAQIVSGLLYEVLCSVYEERLASGTPARSAVVEAASVVGTLMFRALTFVGEHRVSLREYGLALLRVDRDSYGGRCRDALREGLVARGLVSASEDIDAEFTRRDEAVPVFELPPEVKDPKDVLARVEGLEASQLRCARQSASGGVALVRHSCRFPFEDLARAERVELRGDETGVDGTRIVRLRFQVPLVKLLPTCMTESDDPGYKFLENEIGTADIYASLVLDAQGRLIAYHVDKPWQ